MQRPQSSSNTQNGTAAGPKCVLYMQGSIPCAHGCLPSNVHSKGSILLTASSASGHLHIRLSDLQITDGCRVLLAITTSLRTYRRHWTALVGLRALHTLWCRGRAATASSPPACHAGLNGVLQRGAGFSAVKNITPHPCIVFACTQRYPRTPERTYTK